MTNYKPTIAIVYASATGHTESLAQMVTDALVRQGAQPDVFRVKEFDLVELCRYDIVVVGTYTWMNGEIPKQLHGLYEAMEQLDKTPITGVFGTGDSCFATYCGAVDLFRDMLHATTVLAATLKVEQMPSAGDRMRCDAFAESVLTKYSYHKGVPLAANF
ncbi:flavodoxin domain-containing protein [Planococcus sp. A6]|uniref:flavodoxin domain-containing protein n=1 Tax=Planococcus sp. A6 TaxID=2992760 RepID=UPI00237B719A|nr:flavodoxin domain-containing protein [Planococcus sp. A6]MDE0584596.1 flavodoxin domain-containing protein [Planococcus sp. A6]